MGKLLSKRTIDFLLSMMGNESDSMKEMAVQSVKRIFGFEWAHPLILSSVLDVLENPSTKIHMLLLNMMPTNIWTVGEEYSKRFVLTTLIVLLNNDRFPGYTRALAKHLEISVKQIREDQVWDNFVRFLKESVDNIDTRGLCIIIGTLAEKVPFLAKSLQSVIADLGSRSIDKFAKRSYIMLLNSFISASSNNKLLFDYYSQQLQVAKKIQLINEPILSDLALSDLLAEYEKILLTRGYLPLSAGERFVESLIQIVESSPNELSSVLLVRLTLLLEQEVIVPQNKTVQLLSMLAERPSLLKSLCTLFTALFHKLDDRVTVVQNLCELYSRDLESFTLKVMLVQAFEGDHCAQIRKCLDAIAICFFDETIGNGKPLPNIYWSVIGAMIAKASQHVVDSVFRRLVQCVHVESEFLFVLMKKRAPSPKLVAKIEQFRHDTIDGLLPG